MAERLTTVRPLDRDRFAAGIGWTEHGRQTREHMLAEMRRIYRHRLEEAQYVLNARDEEFVVETHTGTLIRRNVREVT